MTDAIFAAEALEALSADEKDFAAKYHMERAARLLRQFAETLSVPPEALQNAMVEVSGQLFQSFVRNCHITLREGDGPLFVQEARDKPIYARLDGYSIAPLASAASPQRFFTATDVEQQLQDGLKRIVDKKE